MPLPAPPGRGPPSGFLAASLAAAGRSRGILADPGARPAPPEDDPGVESWLDAGQAAGLLSREGDGWRVRPYPQPGDLVDEEGVRRLEEGFRDPLPRPRPGDRVGRKGPHPVGSPRRDVILDPVEGRPGRVLVFPGRGGRLARSLAREADEVRVHEPDPRLRRGLGEQAGKAVVVAESPATEMTYDRGFDLVVADRALQASRSLVGLLGRLHHALVDGGILVLHDVLLDEAEDPRAGRARAARALRFHLRARGRDQVTRQDLWRLLTETGFREIQARHLDGGRWMVSARR